MDPEHKNMMLDMVSSLDEIKEALWAIVEEIRRGREE
jgi:hypothetical protein